MIIDCEFDRERHAAIGIIVADVPEKLSEPNSSKDQNIGIGDWKAAYPNLEVFDEIGDGDSCQFQAVSLAVWGHSRMADQLRQQTVDLIAKKWDSVGVFMIAEVAGQLGCTADQLDKDECLVYMRSRDKRGRYLGQLIDPSLPPRNHWQDDCCAGAVFRCSIQAYFEGGEIL